MDTKILESLIQTFTESGLVSAAIEEAQMMAGSKGPQIEKGLEAIHSDIRKVEANIEKYLTAFEEGSMPESVCGPRLQDLGDRLMELKRRREELLAESALQDSTPLSEEELSQIMERIQEAMASGSPAELKAVAQEYVHEIRVENRQAIYPTFRLPCQE